MRATLKAPGQFVNILGSPSKKGDKKISTKEKRLSVRITESL